MRLRAPLFSAVAVLATLVVAWLVSRAPGPLLAEPLTEIPNKIKVDRNWAVGKSNLRVVNQDRSPFDLVLAKDDSWLVTINQTSNSASLVRTADGVVLDEVAVGQYPTAVALLPDGRRLLVSGGYSGDVTLLEVADDQLKRLGTIQVGYEPYGIAVTADGNTAYVALSMAAQVAEIDLRTQKVVAHIEVGRWPRYLALTSDGSRLAVGCSGDRGVAVVDTATRKQLYLEMFKGLNLGHMQTSADNQYVYLPWLHYGENLPNQGNIRQGWVLGNRLARVRLDGPALREAISLDKQGLAVSDAHGIAITRDEEWVIVTTPGTHELLLMKLPGLPYSKVGGTEHIPTPLYNDKERFARIPMGGRPLAVRLSSDDRLAYVANYLDNSVQVVDLEARKVVRTLPLGAPVEPSLARRGEAIFYDGVRSFDQWYSCHSCHFEGGTNAVSMDTLNDGTRDTFKTIPLLFNLHETSPWTWHGWQQDLGDAMRKSLTVTMVGPPPTDDDVAALLAYFKQLTPPPNPHRLADGQLSPAAERGKAVFHSETAGCASCHSGPYFTDGEVHEVGLESRRDRYRGFNTPTLLGAYRKVKLLHHGYAKSLDELLTDLHAPENVTGAGQLTDTQRADLIEYLKSL